MRITGRTFALRAAVAVVALLGVGLATQAPALAAAQVSVSLTRDEATVVAGEVIHYHLTIQNTGTETLTGITVDDNNAIDCEDPVADLTVGASHTIDCAYTTVSPADIGTRTNQATVDTAETPPAISNQVSTTVTNPLSITKADTSGGPVVAGNPISYHIEVTNDGPNALHNVVVTDTNAPNCATTIPTLNAGATNSYNCSYTTQDPSDIGTYHNIATADADEANATDSNQTSTVVQAPTGAVEVTKTRDEATVGAGDPIHYHVTVTNTGTAPLTNVRVTDANAPLCGTSAPGATLPFSLAPGANQVIDCEFVTSNANIGTYTNTAFAEADWVGGSVSDLSNPVSTEVQTSLPAFTVTKSRDEASVFAGQDIHYHVTITNTGNRVLTGVDITDTNAPDCGAGSIPDIAVGGSYTKDCTYTTLPADVGTRTNTATVDTAQTAPSTSNQVSTTVVAPVASFTVQKSADQTTIVAGEDIDYHITITNTGNQDLTGITITDANAPDCQTPTPAIPATLAPGASYTGDCSVTVPDLAGDSTGTYANTAKVDTNQTHNAGTHPNDMVSSNTVIVSVQEPNPHLTITKSRDEAVVAVGDDIHYHLHIENTGNVRVTGIVVEDDNALDCVEAVPDLNPGEDHDIDCVYTAQAGDIGTYQNAAAVTANDYSDAPWTPHPTPPAVSNVVQTTVQAANPAFTVTKSRDQAVVAVGDPITYHITVTNTGNQILHDVTVTDTNAPDCVRPPEPAGNALGDLAVGASVTVDCSYTPVNADIGTRTNTAVADTDETPPLASNTVSTTVQAPAPALTVVKNDVQDQVFAGQVINYTITLTNSGNQNLTGIFLTDTNAPDCNRSVGQIPDLTPGQSHTVNCSYTSQLSDSPSRPNSATADSDQTVGVLSNSVDTTVLTPSANMLVTKSVDENGVAVGQPIHYHINILNIGNQTLTGISILDANAPGCARAAGTLASLAPGADLTVNCSFTPNQNHIGVRTNTAVADSAQTSAVLSNQVSTNVHAVGTCLGATVTVYISDGDVPTGGADVIQGTSSGDSINGLGGNDRICALGGNDTVNGGAGNDRLNGDADNDTLLGSDGTDTLNGGPGTDTVHGDAGNDAVQGATDDDTLYGDAGTDSVTGGGGDDDLFGGTGADSLFGGENEDALYGDTENDRLEGGNGADTEDGGAGLDTVLGNGGDDVLNGGTENDALGGGAGVDEVNGGPGIDSVNGNEGNDTVNGNEGNDLVVGAGGADTVHGGPNNDRAQGDGGNDHVFGDENNDQVLGGSGIDALDGGTETDSCAGGTGSPDSAVNCESTTGVP